MKSYCVLAILFFNDRSTDNDSSLGRTARSVTYSDAVKEASIMIFFLGEDR